MNARNGATYQVPEKQKNWVNSLIFSLRKGTLNDYEHWGRVS